MASRKSHKAHRKSHRKSHSKSHRKSHSKSHSKSQHGGASCAAQPLFNRSLFGQQGGMAPITDSNAYQFLDTAGRLQAQVASLDTAFSELQSVIPHQAGGRRRRTVRRKGRKGSRSSHSVRRKSRKQHGGALAGFSDPYMLGVDIANSGSNPQFLDYLPAKGAQAL
jgi:hypothetical protein